MAKYNINNIENVEGKYHIMFLEGKTKVEEAKQDLRGAWFSLLLFFALVVVFIIFSEFNLYYAAFVVVFLAFFVAFYIYLKREKRKGVKICVYAVQKSKTTDIIAKQVDNRTASKAIVKSMSNSIDKFDSKKRDKTFLEKIKRKRKHTRIVEMITQFEEEEKKTAD